MDGSSDGGVIATQDTRIKELDRIGEADIAVAISAE
jgi:hypothetical protein